MTIASFPIFAVRCFLRQDTQNEVIFGENDEIVTSVISIPLEKYPASREKINEIISIINERLHFKKAIRCNYFLEENRYELNFIIPKKNESFTEEIINSFTNTSLNELQRNILLFTYVEKNLEPIEAFDIAYNLDINFDLPLFYRGVRNYDSKELGYSIRYDNANENPTLIVDEYYYSNGRTWKDGIADDELKKHFKSLADDLPTFYKEFKETTPIVIEKISNQEYLTQTYELLRNDKKAFSKTYITAINGKLLKFRVSFYLTDKESKEKADKLIEMRTAKRLELLQKAK